MIVAWIEEDRDWIGEWSGREGQRTGRYSVYTDEAYVVAKDLSLAEAWERARAIDPRATLRGNVFDKIEGVRPDGVSARTR